MRLYHSIIKRIEIEDFYCKYPLDFIVNLFNLLAFISQGKVNHKFSDW